MDGGTNAPDPKAGMGDIDLSQPIDIQQLLDDWLENHPEYHQYVTALYYVPFGHPPPEDATHQVRLQSLRSGERQITVAAAIVPQYAALVDALLAMIATSPS